MRMNIKRTILCTYVVLTYYSYYEEKIKHLAFDVALSRICHTKTCVNRFLSLCGVANCIIIQPKSKQLNS